MPRRPARRKRLGSGARAVVRAAVRRVNLTPAEDQVYLGLPVEVAESELRPDRGRSRPAKLATVRGMRATFRAVAMFLLAAAFPVSASARTPYVIGGTAAAPGAYPFAAYLKVANTYACTGTVLTPTIVLTAAHCVLDEPTGTPYAANQIEVRTGSVSSSGGGSLVTATAVAVYPGFTFATLHGDVAVLRVPSVSLGADSGIRLATSADGALYAAGLPVVYAGWGRTDNGATPPPQLLQQGSATVLANTDCRAADPDFSATYDLCVSSGQPTSVCNGDSGGPLLAGTPGAYVLIGVTSYGASSTCGGSPDFFARVSSLQPWIASVISSLPPPSTFVATFVAPSTPTAVLDADGIVVTYAAPAADPATLLTGFSVTLRDAAGAQVSSQLLAPTLTVAAFPVLVPGTYTVSVTANYTDGASAPALSAPVILAPPVAIVKPVVSGKGYIGSTLRCTKGTWRWPGTSTLSTTWLRDRKPTGSTEASYPITDRDGGSSLACAVTLRTSSGATAVSTSRAIDVAVKLRVVNRPRVRAAGSRLVCTSGRWKHTGALEVRYRWLRDGHPIRGARKRRYTVTSADRGHRLACRVRVSAGSQTRSLVTHAIRL